MSVSSLPHSSTLMKAAELCMKLDKPLQLDYYALSVQKLCKIGIEEEQKVLWKSQDEHTSPIKTVLKIENENGCDLLLETMNTIYVVSGLMI